MSISVIMYRTIVHYSCKMFSIRLQLLLSNRTNIPIDYRVRQNKTPQHENCNFSEIREYFCVKFCSFVQRITVHEYAVSRCIYSTYAEVTETST